MSDNTQTPKINQKRIAFYVFIGVALGIWGEMMPNEVKEDLEKFFVVTLSFPSFKVAWWVVIALLLIVAIWVELRKEIVETNITVPSNDFEKERNRIIESLAKRYQSRYNQKLDERITLDVKLSYTQQGTDKKFVELYFANEAKTQAELHLELAETVQKFRYVLVVGQQGAGKTTLILDTAIALLSLAKESKTAIPVIFNLSSWRKDSANFSTWLIDMLVEGNGFSRKLAQEMIDNKHIAPLLDGFDELGRLLTDENERSILRGQCLVAISEFLKYDPEYVVICSRTEEYKAVKANAPIQAELTVNPMNVEQLEKVLKPLAEKPFLESKRLFTNPTAAQNILHLLRTTPSLKQSLCVPFYFHLATQVFDNQFFESEIPKRRKEFESYLVSAFVEKKLDSSKNRMFSDADKSKHWLIWLANFLKSNNDLNFEISHLQPQYLQKPYKYSQIFLNTMYAILVWTLVFSIKNELPLSGIGVLIFYALKGKFDKILTYDVKKSDWSFLTSRYFIIMSIAFPLFFIYLFKITNPNSSLLVSIIVGLLSSFTLSWVIMSDKLMPFMIINTPYQRLTSRLWSHSVKGSLFVIVLNVITYLPFLGLSYILVKRSILTGLAGTLIILWFSPLTRHFLLRLCFKDEKSLPLCLVHFLNHATENLRFLERDGGSWRFRHQILQDYFASLSEKK